MLRVPPLSRLSAALAVVLAAAALLIVQLTLVGKASAAPVNPPAAPFITDGSGGFRSATVQFQVPAANGSPITGYGYRIDGGAWQALNVSIAATTVTGSITGLTNGVSVSVEVRATNAIGSSGPSNPYPIYVSGPPTPPLNVTATAGNASATVRFDPPQDDGGIPVGSYVVTVRPSARTVSCPASPCAIANLINGTTYTFTVRAITEIGPSDPSAASNPVTPQAPATVPSVPLNVAASAGNGQVTISFARPSTDGGAAITGYVVTVGPTGRTVSCPASPCVIPGLANGTNYTFTMHATNRVGNSPESAPTAIVRPAPVRASAPSLTVTNTTTSSVTVTFSQPGSGGSPITGYQYSLDGGVTYLALSGRATGPTITATISGLNSNTRYAILARAITAAGAGQASPVATGTTKAALVPTPAVNAGQDTSPTLAATGTHSVGALLTALIFLTGGLLLTCAGRRRPRKSPAQPPRQP